MRLFTNHLTRTLLLLIGLLGLAGFICLAFYNHPTIDDFGHADAVKRYGLWEAQKFQFQYRTGRFASTLIVCLFNPLLFTHWLAGIKVYPVVFLFSFLFVFHFFLSRCFNKQLTFLQLFPFSLLLFICFILKLESVLELFYWFAANCVYGIPMLLFLLHLGLLLRLFQQKHHAGAYRLLVPIGVLGMLLCGSNELDLINILAVDFLTLVYLFYAAPRKLAWSFLACYMLIAGAAFFSLSAPGNLARARTLNQDLSPLLSLPHAASIVLTSGKYVLLKSRDWIFGLPLISASLVLAILTWKYQVKTIFRFQHFKQVFIYFLLVYAILIVQLAPVLLHSGLAGLVDRAVNVIWFHFFIYWLIGLFLLIPMLKQEVKTAGIVNPAFQTRCFHLILAAFLAGVLTSFHVVQAYQDLCFKAPAYDAGLKKRYALIRQARIKGQMALQVPPLFPTWQRYPRTICKLELSQDPAHYFNSSVATYFGLESITLAAPLALQAR